jgi:hypothetical protein
MNIQQAIKHIDETKEELELIIMAAGIPKSRIAFAVSARTVNGCFEILMEMIILPEATPINITLDFHSGNQFTIH